MTQQAPPTIEERLAMAQQDQLKTQEEKDALVKQIQEIQQQVYSRIQQLDADLLRLEGLIQGFNVIVSDRQLAAELKLDTPDPELAGISRPVKRSKSRKRADSNGQGLTSDDWQEAKEEVAM